MKIAIFHYHWLIQVHTAWLAEELSRKGHEVTVYSMGFCRQDAAIPVKENLQFKKIAVWNKFDLFFYRGMDLLFRKLSGGKKRFIAYYMKRLSLEIKRGMKEILRYRNDYDIFIGMEKGGALFCESLHDVTGIPFVYYSLELYDDSVDYSGNYMYELLRRSEPSVHKKALATIIQDENRANALFSYNNVDMQNVFLLPVGVYNTQASEVYSYFGKKICLIFGNVYMGVEDFLALCTSLPSDYMLVLHNFDLSFYKRIIDKHGLDNVIVDETFLTEEGVQRLIKSASIGVAYYPATCDNMRYIAFSSEKTARYLQSGVPLLTNNQGNFGALFAEFACGVAVAGPEEFAQALRAIDTHYEQYSHEALRAYAAYYDYQGNFERMYAGMCRAGILRQTTP